MPQKKIKEAMNYELFAAFYSTVCRYVSFFQSLFDGSINDLVAATLVVFHEIYFTEFSKRKLTVPAVNRLVPVLHLSPGQLGKDKLQKSHTTHANVDEIRNEQQGCVHEKLLPTITNYPDNDFQERRNMPRQEKEHANRQNHPER